MNLAVLLGEQFKNYDESKNCYEKSIQLNPKNDKAYMNLAILLYE